MPDRRAARTSRVAEQSGTDGERLVALFRDLVEPLGAALPAGTEVVLHDHSLVPNSIVAIHGSVTGRKVGDPSNTMLLERVTAATVDESYLGYETRLPDGRRLRSTAIIIRDFEQRPVATLSVTIDTTIWETLQHFASSMLGEAGTAPSVPMVPAMLAGLVAASASAAAAAADQSSSPGAHFVSGVDQAAQLIISREIAAVGKPVTSMKKADKVAVVRALKARGVFLIKDSVNQVADALGVTRFTIYNYLNEIEATA